eukprot:8840229-Alexandrium_andersonii.AAC.1
MPRCTFQSCRAHSSVPKECEKDQHNVHRYSAGPLAVDDGARAGPILPIQTAPAGPSTCSDARDYDIGARGITGDEHRAEKRAANRNLRIKIRIMPSDRCAKHSE